MATTSEKGTLIRIYAISQNKFYPIETLRRGTEYASIYSIAFDWKNKYLAISSKDHDTIHVYNIGKKFQEYQKSRNKKSKMEKINIKESKLLIMKKFMIPFAASEWSFAQMKALDQNCLVAFT